MKKGKAEPLKASDLIPTQEIDLELLCKPAAGAVFPFTSRRYRQLAEEGILPAVKRGKIDPIAACRMLIAHQQALIDGQGGLSFTDEKKRLTRINADRKELQLQKERGELIHTEKATRLWGAVCQSIKSRMLAIPTKTAPLLFSLKSIPEVKDRLEKVVHEVLNEIANPDLERIARMGGYLPDPGKRKAPARAHNLGMGRPKKATKPRK